VAQALQPTWNRQRDSHAGPATATAGRGSPSAIVSNFSPTLCSRQQHTMAMSLPSSSPDLGAGLKLTTPRVGDLHPAGPSKHGTMGQAERAFSAASTFLSGVLA